MHMRRPGDAGFSPSKAWMERHGFHPRMGCKGETLPARSSWIARRQDPSPHVLASWECGTPDSMRMIRAIRRLDHRFPFTITASVFLGYSMLGAGHGPGWPMGAPQRLGSPGQPGVSAGLGVGGRVHSSLPCLFPEHLRSPTATRPRRPGAGCCIRPTARWRRRSSCPWARRGR